MIARHLVIYVFCLTPCWCVAPREDESIYGYSNNWVAEIHGGEDVAKMVAKDLDFTYKYEFPEFEDHYLLQREDHPKIAKRSSDHLTEFLIELDEVKWAEQQEVPKWSHKNYIPKISSLSVEEDSEKIHGVQKQRGLLGSGSVSNSIGQTQQLLANFGNKAQPAVTTVQDQTQDTLNKIGKLTTGITQKFTSETTNKIGELTSSVNKQAQKLAVDTVGAITSTIGIEGLPVTPIGEENLSKYEGPTQHISMKSSQPSPYGKMFSDPLWKNQWYEHDYRTSIGPVMDHNIVPVYKLGITGKGVLVAVCDDGVKPNLDLEGNVDRKLSYDMCHNTEGGKGGLTGGTHGTQCAGVIGMISNNGKCGVGVAYKATLLSVRVICLLGMFTYARGMVHSYSKVDIYSNSWGPPDDGEDMKKSSSLFLKAIKKGVEKGRKGKGSIYVFAAGNGRLDNDNCAADYVVNNPYTIPITAVSQAGTTTYYGERCTGIFASTYSGSDGEENVVSTTEDGKCTTEFVGTSAAVPIASGIFALVLEANPNLTYRDIYHLIVMTSEVAPLATSNNWYKNAAGFWVNNDFGFGLLNAYNMVKIAKEGWKRVPDKGYCIVELKMDNYVEILAGESATIPIETRACQGTSESIRFLEQIELFSTVEYISRGAIAMNITSPQGTMSQILETRKNDNNINGLHEWSIKSVHNWGEDPRGVWYLKIKANIRNDIAEDSKATVKAVTLRLHGTYDKPDHYNKKRVYAAFRLPNGKTSEEQESSKEQ